MEQLDKHANSRSICKKVNCGDQAVIFPNESHEGENQTSAISELSKFTGEANSEISIISSVEIYDQDTNNFKKKIEDLEYKVKYLENENKQINEDLLGEKKKSSKLEKKLQFVKDNQEVFMRLKEAYINMKYNEAAGRKMIEIREKGVQTWEGIICSSCIESEELRRQIDILIQKYSELFVVSPGEMEHLINTVKYLKDLVDRREASWESNMRSVHKLQSYILVLEEENRQLKDGTPNEQNVSKDKTIIRMLEDSKLEQKLLDDRKIEEMQKFVESVNKELEKLKKIVIKYEKKFREIKELHPGRYINPLSDKEYKIVQQIILKYNAKVQKRYTGEVFTSRSSSICSERTDRSRRRGSPLRNAQIHVPRLKEVMSIDRPKTARSIKRNKDTDAAIMNLDSLFD